MSLSLFNEIGELVFMVLVLLRLGTLERQVDRLERER